MSPISPPEKKQTDKAAPKRRQYNSPLRQQQSAETRERIVAAGADLVHSLPVWDWKSLTARAISERAEVSERTVHRYFPTERKLRDAVLQRLVEESGIQLDSLKLEDFGQITAGLLGYLSSFDASRSMANVEDPSLLSADQMRCKALLRAVAEASPAWPRQDQEAAAALLDLSWSPPPYERLITAWDFDHARAVEAITWLIGLIEEAIRHGKRPGSNG